MTGGPTAVSEIQPLDAIHLLRTMVVHAAQVRRGLQRVTHELERRALVHDESKFYADEFAGFSRINRIARENPYGSMAYRESMARECEVINLHYMRNSHHPEHCCSGGSSMSWLDIIEMVCDWRAAYLAYGSQGTWEENLKRQRERYGPEWFTREQWWLVEQVAAFLVDGEETP